MKRPRTCRVCGCTDNDCSGCIARTGQRCHWVAADLCSACVGQVHQAVTMQALALGVPVENLEPALAPKKARTRPHILRTVVLLQLRAGEPLIDLDSPGYCSREQLERLGHSLAPGAELFTYHAAPAAWILEREFGRRQLRPSEGPLVKDFARLQAAATVFEGEPEKY